MKILITIMLILSFFSCENSIEHTCKNELIPIESVDIKEKEENLEISIIYGLAGCDIFDRTEENLTDSTYEIYLYKCGVSDPDIMCPAVYVLDSITKSIPVDLSIKPNFNVIVNNINKTLNKGG